MNNPYSKKRGKRMALALVLIAAQAAYIYPAFGLVLRELGEKELANMRGKFVSRGQIQYFGLSMHTQWDYGAGGSHEVGMDIELDLSSRQPKVSRSVSGTLGEAKTRVNAPRQKVAVEQKAVQNQLELASDNINGTVQTIQVAGNDNEVRNSVELSVKNLDAGDPPPSEILGMPKQEPVTKARPTDVVRQTPQTFRNHNGVITEVNTQENPGFSIAIGDNRVVQGLGTNTLGNAHQLLQSVKLHGNAHRIVNTLKLEVGFSNGSKMRSRALRLNESLRGIR